ncbi:uncharacterized protein LOC126903283 isoform X2 [Daktulosphaira vitifoliae]|uniref:uncharacterized protein LOC126903283 isoform X2 n=1 Tax=Daktulosphaira vitifoliae TaxID=58002 RepID=UPI0021A98FF0|nr:uncharacterized protein LOC126903283 isoform X2 [Daktulosphaira vitifoliae]
MLYSVLKIKELKNRKSMSNLEFSTASKKITSLTPCRRMGLKRKSLGSPLHSSLKKKIKPSNEFLEKTASTKNKYDICMIDGKLQIQSRITYKQKKIEELNYEIKNSKQHNLLQIQDLSKKWLCVCQDALKSLHQKLMNNAQTMEDLIISLGIDPNLIQFDPLSQEFI